jgi:Probable Zinc-ribbon domain
MGLSFRLELVLTLKPPDGDACRSIFRRTQRLLRRRAHRQAVLFVASDAVMSRYTDLIDFLFAELVEGWIPYVMRYYRGEGPLLCHAPAATPEQINAWDTLLVAAIHVAKAALDRRERPAWADFRAAAHDAAAEWGTRIDDVPADLTLDEDDPGGSPEDRENLRLLLESYAKDELVELTARLGLGRMADLTRDELLDALTDAARPDRLGPNRGTGLRILRLVKPNRRARQPLLSDARPDLVAEWHPTRNGDATPDDFTCGTAASAWWRCTRDPTHEWRTGIRHRARGGSGCPYCARTKIAESTNLAARYPELAAQWVTEDNGPLPDDLGPSSRRRVTWRCPKGHTWQATVVRRAIRGTGCPTCPKHGATADHNLAIAHPELARQWHPEKNGDLRPEHVNPCAREPVWWQCPQNPEHAWRTTIGNRVHGRGRCPICSNRQVLPENSLAAKFPAVAAEWHPTRNAPLTPEKVPPKSPKKYWWRCAAGHEWETTVGSRTFIGNGCRVCTAERRRAARAGR